MQAQCDVTVGTDASLLEFLSLSKFELTVDHMSVVGTFGPSSCRFFPLMKKLEDGGKRDDRRRIFLTKSEKCRLARNCRFEMQGFMKDEVNRLYDLL
uniref:Uncharacterized protein n=1 Tax=Vespula pensylvanica TaxID=30213 RepID=A0A834K422_VESPE|nr:hypothetical protein H0235_016423 [Vespula pensylvanica]